MGNVLESCGIEKNCCCDHHSRVPSKALSNELGNFMELDADEEDEEEEENDNDDEITNSKKISKSKKKLKIPIPKDVLDIPVRTNSFIFERSVNPLNFYEELETIGSGAYGLVKKVCLKSNPQAIRAMKIISTKNILKGIDKTKFYEEIYILKNLDHPNIMKIYENFIYKDNFYIISEFFDQGDLLTKLQRMGTMNQIVVKLIMEQVFNAVAYLHSKGVLHGDIKLENIMMYTTAEKPKNRFSVINFLLWILKGN